MPGHARHRDQNDTNTDHEQRDGDVLGVVRLDGAQHGADDGAAETHEGDHDDEPADAHGLSHHEAAAGLGLLVAQVGGAAGGASGPSGSEEGPGAVGRRSDG